MQLTRTLLAAILFGTPALAAAEAGGPKCYLQSQLPKEMGIKTRYRPRSFDPTLSTVDESVASAQKLIRAPLIKPIRMIVQVADRISAVKDDNERDAMLKCVSEQMVIFDKEHFLEHTTTKSDVYFKDWLLSALAISLLKIRESLPNGVILEYKPEWLLRTTLQIIPLHKDDVNRGKYNNHLYWGGLAASAVAKLVYSTELMNFADLALKMGLLSIRSDGFLPQELARGKLARHYHIFAAAPLAAIMTLQPQSITPTGREAYCRLATAISGSGIDDEKGKFRAITMIDQQRDSSVTLSDLRLIQTFCQSINQQYSAWPERLGQEFYGYDFFLGGDVRFLLQYKSAR